MKLFVSSLVLFLVLFVSFKTGRSQDASCDCVYCQGDMIAICKYETGRCVGRCIKPPKTSISAREFTADILTAVLGRRVSTRDLSTQPQKYIKVIDGVLTSNGRKVSITFENREIEFGIGLTAEATEFLRTARKELSSQSTRSQKRRAYPA